MKRLFSSFSFAFKMISYRKFAGVLYIFLTLSLGAATMGFPYIVGAFFQNINEITTKITNLYLLITYPAVYTILIFAVSYLLLNYLYDLYSVKICVKIEENLYRDVFAKLFNAKKSEMKKISVGDIQIRFRELDQVCDYARYFIDVFKDIFIIVASAVYIYILSPYLLAISSLLLITLISSEIIKRMFRKYIIAHRKAGSNLASKYIYAINKYDDISNLRANKRIVDENISTYQIFLGVLCRKLKFVAASEAVKNALLFSLLSVTALCLVLFVKMGLIESYQVATYALILNLLKDAFVNISNVIEKRNEFELQEDYYHEFMKIKHDDILFSKSPINKLTIKNLYFSYDSSKQIFESLNTTFEKGVVHVIQGGNGTGKSTLFNLINHGLERDSGEITSDLNLPINNGDVVTITPDNCYFFTGDIVKDIQTTTGKDEAEIIDILDHFELDYKQLSKNKINDGGQMSTGQKKIASIVRGFLVKPKVLLLDEPLANLSAYYIDKVLSYAKKMDSIVCLISHDITKEMLVSKSFKIHKLASDTGQFV